jgi:hypothetical protein
MYEMSLLVRKVTVFILISTDFNVSCIAYTGFCCPCRWSVTMSLNCGYQRAYCSSPTWYVSMESHGGIIFTGENRRTLRKTCPIATLSTTNPTWTDLGAKTGLRGERQATDRLSHGTAWIQAYCSLVEIICLKIQRKSLNLSPSRWSKLTLPGDYRWHDELLQNY